MSDEQHQIHFRLKGVTDLLMHRDDVEASDEVAAMLKMPEYKGAPKGDDRVPPWKWQTYLYSDGSHIAFPTQNISAALRVAGAKWRLKGSTTYKRVTQSGILFLDEYATFGVLDGNGNLTHFDVASIESLRDLSFGNQKKAVREMGFDIDVRRAPVGRTKHVRARPRFSNWVVKGDMIVTDPELMGDLDGVPMISHIFNTAGDQCGLGDWRPSSPKSPGPYGRFEVELE